jgi:hypothetical protein
VITLFYVETQYRIMTQNLGTTVNIVGDVHSPYQVLDLKIGGDQTSEPENYLFNFAFVLSDLTTVGPA